MLDLEEGKEGQDGEFRVQRIRNFRIKNGKEECLVQWFGIGFEDSWEPFVMKIAMNFKCYI